MTMAVVAQTGHVTCSQLADGRFVQLAGALGADQLPRLRETLLTDLPPTCMDVVIDAGEVAGVDDCALAVVVAARQWVEDQGARFLLSRTSQAFDEALQVCGVADEFVRLSELPSGRTEVPRQRTSG